MTDGLETDRPPPGVVGSTGPLGERFDRFMERSLYGPDGFYQRHGVAGRARGDFITSPEVGPLFGAVLANALVHWWDELGRPRPVACVRRRLPVPTPC